ncbi:MAG: PH domain-containing protein [Nitrospinae bacterium]|nr:PH domain-containing protein [Nitrospinota bacterium]
MAKKIDKLVQMSRKHLDDDESTVEVIMGAYETEVLGNDSVRTGIFIATETRLVFFAKKMFGFQLESFPYNNISSMEMSKGLMGHAISFFGSGNKVSMKWISSEEETVHKFVSFVRSKLESSKSSDTSESRLQYGISEQIREIAELHEQGILTDSEFESKKQELLDRI